jgi:hypothetical protein
MTLVEKSVDPRVKRTRKLLQLAFLEVFKELDPHSLKADGKPETNATHLDVPCG